MHEYDVALKSVLRRSSGTVLRKLTGLTVTRWHNVELPAVQNRRADMLGETADGRLLHIELQSTNWRDMALRMLEYSLAIHRQFHRFPEQMVLYVGAAPLRMKSHIAGPGLQFECRMVDIRSLDSEELIARGTVEDNVIAVLGRFGDERETVRRILTGIARSGSQRRTLAIEELMLIAGLRRLGKVIIQEAVRMPILNDIMDHEVLGPERRKGIRIGLKQGREEGLAEGREEGREQGERLLAMDIIAKRFGPLAPGVKKQIEKASAAKVKRMALRVLDARTLDEVLK